MMISTRQQVPEREVELPPKIPMTTFLGVAWGGTAITLILLIGRLYTRIHVHRRLYFDDALVILAWVLLLTNTAIWQHVAADLYELSNVQAGLAPVTPSFPEHVHTYLVHSIPVITLFFTGLWAIKLSFLVFFRRLGSMVRNQRVHWWVVLVLTVTTWIISFGTIKYDCLTGSIPYLIENCRTGRAVRFQRMSLMYNTAMDVITDVAIITIPVHLLWNVRISLRQKLGLMGIFSLTTFIMIFAIVRATVISTYSNQPEATWLYLWSSIEQTVSIIIACLASFRSLFTEYDPSREADRLRSQSWLDGSWSPKPLLRKASSIFSVSRYRRSSSSSSEAKYDTSFASVNHSTVCTDKAQAAVVSTSLDRNIRVTHEICVSHSQEASQIV